MDQSEAHDHTGFNSTVFVQLIAYKIPTTSKICIGYSFLNYTMIPADIWDQTFIIVSCLGNLSVVQLSGFPVNINNNMILL